MAKGFTTRAVHGRTKKDKDSGAVTYPIYQTSTFSQDSPGMPRQHMGRAMSYARSENPTRTVLEDSLAEVEGAGYGLSFCTGLAAVACVMNTLQAGDRVVACADLYGGAYRMFTKVYAKLGISFEFVNVTDLGEVERVCSQPTRLLWLESPSNPLLNVTDIAAASAIAKRAGAEVLVDNTFATPYLQRPLELGADIVLHSTTKYLNGHADVVNGALLSNDKAIWDKLKFVQNACGLVPGPQDCYLVIRGLKTLALRMDRHLQNTEAVVQWLKGHPKVTRVYYPGLPDHPNHEVAKRQMSGYGAMLSFDVAGGLEGARKLLESLELFTLAESLGCVQSLANHPASMTHASVEPHVRHEVGIGDGLVRLSIGIEDADDLIADLSQAMDKV